MTNMGESTSQRSVFERLGLVRGGIIMLVGAFMAGAGANAVLGDALSHEERISVVEARQDSTLLPLAKEVEALVSRTDAVELRVDVVSARLDGIETLLWCMHYDVETCPAPAPSPPTRRD